MLTARIVDIVKNGVRSIFRFGKNWRRFVRFFLNKNWGISGKQKTAIAIYQEMYPEAEV